MPEPLPEIFVCRRCGECCKGYGGTYVSETDIRRISAFLGIPPDAFRSRYCRPSGGRLLLAQDESGYCVFWDGLCTIHPVKPPMCRNWPFIPGLRADPGNWRIMAGSCPGMDPGAPEDLVFAHLERENPE